MLMTTMDINIQTIYKNLHDYIKVCVKMHSRLHTHICMYVCIRTYINVYIPIENIGRKFLSTLNVNLSIFILTSFS
jgi:hypothetical protein